MNIVSIGEILWDVFDDSQILGGAPFNFSVHASRLGHKVAFVSAVGADERGRLARARAIELGLADDFIQTAAEVPTGAVTVRVDANGQPDFTIHRPAAYDALRLSDSELSRLAALRPEWLYFGSLHQAETTPRKETLKLIDKLPGTQRFYDINLRRDSYTPELVEDLMSRAHAVKLNEDEAAEIDLTFGHSHSTLAEFTRDWSQRMGWRALAVTRGAHGCAIRIGEDYAETPGYAVTVADTVGSGDAFAAAFLHGLSQGWDAARTGDFANRVGALVASRQGGVPMWTIDECWSLK